MPVDLELFSLHDEFAARFAADPDATKVRIGHVDPPPSEIDMAAGHTPPRAAIAA
jgi:hypothetical protein